MGVRLSYREGQFTPAEAQAATGLSLALQRDWRALGLLPPVESGHARFMPRELALMKVMVKLRYRGLKPAACRALAEEAAPSLLYFTLDNRETGLTVEPAGERGERYHDALVRGTKEEFREDMLGIEVGAWFRYVLLPDDSEPKFIHSLDAVDMDDRAEGAAYISLYALALNMVEALPRPLFTLVVPSSFK